MKPLISLLLFCMLQFSSSAQKLSCENLVRSTTSIAGSSNYIQVLSNSFLIQESIGQNCPIGSINLSNYIVRQGFIQPDVLAKLIDNSIPLGLGVITYPNPFTDYLSIAFNETIETEIQITVFDFNGRQLITKKYDSSQSVEMDFKLLKNAYYLLKINANNKQFITKILKK